VKYPEEKILNRNVLQVSTVSRIFDLASEF